MVWFGALIVGVLCGIVPYNYGNNNNDPQMAKVGLICTIIAGLVGGLILAPISAAIFTAIIFSRKKN